MRQAKAFLVVCAGLFLLALAYHLGARSAGAEVGGQIVGFTFTTGSNAAVITANGDMYECAISGWQVVPGSLISAGNFWSGSPTPAQSISIGQLKAKYAKQRP